MHAVGLVARSEIRRRWPALVGLALLIGLVGGITLAAVGGARRTATAVERFRTETRARDVEVQTDDDAAAAVMAAAMRELEGVGGVSVVRGAPAIESGTDPLTNFTRGGGYFLILPDDESFGVDVERAVIVDGHLPTPTAVEEVAVDEKTARLQGVRPGDRLRLDTFTPDEMLCLFTGQCPGAPAASGPALDLRVAGIFRSVDVLQGSDQDQGATIATTPAFVDAHGEDIGSVGPMVMGHVPDRRDASTVLAATEAAAVGILADRGDLEVFVTDAAEIYLDAAVALTDTIAVGLLIFAGVAAVAGTAVIALTLSRHLAATSTSAASLRRIGLDRRGVAATMVLSSVPAVVGGTLVAGVIAVAASPLFPFGAARRAELHPGVRVEGQVVILGAVAVLVVVAVSVGVTAWRQAGTRPGRRRAGSSPAPARWARAVAGPVVQFGTWLAFSRPADDRRVPFRTAFVALAIAVAGIVAATTVEAGVHRTVADTSRWGWNWSASPEIDDPSAAAGLVGDPDLAAVAHLYQRVTTLDGRGVTGLALDVLDGSMEVTILDGRAPRSPSEVALGRTTMRDLGVGIGDVVRSSRGDDHDLVVVGTAVLPSGFDLSEPGRGAVYTPDGLGAALGPDADESDPWTLLTFRSGADPAEVEARLAADHGLRFSGGEPPGVVQNLGRLGPLLWWLAAFFAVLGAAGLLHALVVSVRRRRGEVGALAALGMTRPQVRLAVAWQSVVTVLVGGSVGAIVGVVLGRLAWWLTVGGIGIVDTPVTPRVVLAAGLPVAVVGAVVLAIGPAWAAAHPVPAEALRAE